MRVFSPTTVFPPGSIRGPVVTELYYRIEGDRVILSAEGPADLFPVLEAGRVILTADPEGATPLRLAQEGDGPIRLMETV